ncbi:PhnA domain-containing protein [Promicromonospora sp. NFX87]|uniref:PhnA domain-containing protein n=1 Tax=Promicromonospora sp. NFX87 TaxID=3402691 RepID=UPI003AFB64CA
MSWNPEIRAQRIPGPSARAVVLLGLFSILGAIAGSFVFFAVVVLLPIVLRDPDAVPSVVPMSILAVSGTAALTAVSCDAYVSYGLRTAELRAGYTTLSRTSVRVPHVDLRSNRVVRLAGEPLLSPDEHRRRLALARQSARRDKELRRRRGASPPLVTNDWAAVIRDVDGIPLADGDNVTVVKRLTGKGASTVVPAGTLLRNIRLRHTSDDDRLVGAVVRGAGPVRLRPSAVRKS